MARRLVVDLSWRGAYLYSPKYVCFNLLRNRTHSIQLKCAQANVFEKRRGIWIFVFRMTCRYVRDYFIARVQSVAAGEQKNVSEELGNKHDVRPQCQPLLLNEAPRLCDYDSEMSSDSDDHAIIIAAWNECACVYTHGLIHVSIF